MVTGEGVLVREQLRIPVSLWGSAPTGAACGKLQKDPVPAPELCFGGLL